MDPNIRSANCVVLVIISAIERPASAKWKSRIKHDGSLAAYCATRPSGAQRPSAGEKRKARSENMCDRDHSAEDQKQYEGLGLITRKQFGVMLAAGVAMLLPKVANAVTVSESDVTVTTPDGTADCYFVHPSSGTAPGVLVWPDIFGLRPAFRQMGKRLAESGYSVLVVNPFYRVKKAPTAEQGGATPIQQLMPLAQTLNETTHMSDAK